MPGPRSLPAAVLALAATAGLALASLPPGSAPRAQTAPEEVPNPCLGPDRAQLRCPDLLMGTPADMYTQRTPGGRVLLRATNDVKSRGRGPVMFRGRRTGRRTMSARQHIYRTDGSRLVVRTGAELYFKYVAGQGHYWKFSNAARFELWSVDSKGQRKRRVRTGPKVHYCLRDLERTRPGRRSPRRRVFPACSQDRGLRAVTLGTSTGWSDIYPSTYPEQWINVAGLRGCFAYVHRADPKNHIFESNEANNDSERIVRLPWGRKKRCPGSGNGDRGGSEGPPRGTAGY